ncbi:sodium:solute symporter [Pyrinomonas methylaliphatogenes]|jgi:Na+/proline symporter|uniref:Na+/proline symporter n=1 Tax=Pyrinomonas methylaliphatogenes TaxID=454194 RepID=A0A0B6X0D4_9BACT|nr:sodium:solute symporter [Pyrinomonas methylaliphatogenes]MBX5478529.1 sodium:solute symporter [Pyrinomonas methylaliphatogenes]CDM66801.1 Na+/proline symporter [Pyrinomonas methylaliphatogenes]
MSWIDWAVVVVYLVYIVWDGVRLSKHSGKVEGYFLADRSLPWWAVGLSVMATQLSAITLVGTTGQAFADGMRFIQFYYGLPFAMVILCMTAVPFFYRAKVFTAYEYLERRFDARTRTLTSFFFLLSRGLGVGVIIAAPSVILSIVLGWSEAATVFAMGLTTTLYTMAGGVQAVTWTDVKQMVIIFVGLGVCLFVILSKFPAGVAFTDALHLAGAAGRLTTVDARFSLQESYTLWSGLIGGLFLMLSYFGCDQSQVQRYLTARSVNEGRTSLLMSAFIKIPMQFFILLIGVLVFVFYLFERPPLIFNRVEAQRVERHRTLDYQRLSAEYEAAHAARERAAIEYVRALRDASSSDSEHARSEYLAAERAFEEVREKGLEAAKVESGNRSFTDVNYVFPTFVVQYMPVGVVGLIIAAIFAAAMSSISAELNALATASVIDIYRRHFKPEAADRHYVLVGRLATAFWGVFACIVALYSTSLGSLIEVVNRFGSFFYGSLLGVFVLAFAVPRATGRGAFWGLLLGIVSVWIASRYTEIAFLWFNVIGCAVVVIVGTLLSLTDKKVRARSF